MIYGRMVSQTDSRYPHILGIAFISVLTEADAGTPGFQTVNAMGSEGYFTSLWSFVEAVEQNTKQTVRVVLSADNGQLSSLGSFAYLYSEEDFVKLLRNVSEEVAAKHIDALVPRGVEQLSPREGV